VQKIPLSSEGVPYKKICPMFYGHKNSPRWTVLRRTMKRLRGESCNVFNEKIERMDRLFFTLVPIIAKFQPFISSTALFSSVVIFRDISL